MEAMDQFPEKGAADTRKRLISVSLLIQVKQDMIG